MSIVHKVYLVLVGLLLLCIAVLYFRGAGEHMAKDYFQEKAAVETGNSQAAVAHETVVLKVQAKKEKDNAVLEQVVRENPVWADAVVPDAAASLLQDDSGSTRKVP